MNPLHAFIPLAMLGAAGAAAASTPPVQAEALIYSQQEMFEFDTGDWLAAHAPHLSSKADVISHWAGYSAVSPRVLLALMELQTGIVSNPSASPAVLRRPFGSLVDVDGFTAQTREVAQRLADAMFDIGDDSAQGPVRLSTANPLHTLMLLSDAPPAQVRSLADAGYQQVYARLFGEPLVVTPQRTARTARAAADTLPPVDLLQFPWLQGKRWVVGGAHGDSGSGRYPMNALDFSVGGWWGSDQSRNWVTASAAGTFKRHSSCMAEVFHEGGFSTVYYHLGNMQPQNGTRLEANARIANPANTMRQALCNGGMSTGPHQHWSLRYRGRPVHLNGVTLSGFRIVAIGNSYDTSCRVFNLNKNGKRYCWGPYTNRGPGPSP